MPGKAAAVAVLACALAGTTPAAATEEPAQPVQPDEPVAHRRLVSFTGSDVYESSGLVDAGRLLFTVNDSGDGPVVYGVDTRTGATVSRTTYAAETTEDVEAVAPAPDGGLWVGDTGDNRTSRDTIAVYRVRPLADPADRAAALSGTTVDETVDAPRYELAYPDGARDAEALLVHPRTGRLFVVSKSVFGGTVYRAPRHLDPDRVNELEPFARIAGLVTDGAFFPDGRHVVLRTYATATVSTFPGFAPLGTVRLPDQEQGEGISVGAGGRVLVSSEGVQADVLEVVLPTRLTAAPASTAGPSAPPPSPAPSDLAHPEPRDRTSWVAIGIASAGVAVLAWLALRLSRVRGPR